MNLTKALLATICAGVLSLVVAVSARHAYAQDAGDANENLGTWSAPGSDSAEQSSHKVKTRPLNLRGCWAGNVMDTGDGAGTATFHFDQNSSRKKLLLGSEFDFEWPAMVFARSPMRGAVTATGFTFTARVADQGRVCTVTGTGTGDNTTLIGTVVFGGYCTKVSLFQNVTFSITPGCP
jgi:hypothetical protein